MVLGALAAIWMMPHAAAPAVAAHLDTILVTDSSPEPLTAMADRARVTRSLPVAGEAVLSLPKPVITSRSAPAKPARGGAVSAQAAVFKSTRTGWGNDISWPQCDGPYPGAHEVGVVGVTGGRPFTTNPCLASEFAWARASQMPGGAQLYINLEIDGTSMGPHHCAVDDHACRAYDYGVVTVFDAIARAQSVGVNAGFWWLDVEVGNYWNDLQPDWNQATVQGAIDAARSRGIDVGIYSSVDQWAQIVPPTYHPMVPTWLAVVGDSVMAPGLCALGRTLTGGPVYMVQYDDHHVRQGPRVRRGRGGFPERGNEEGPVRARDGGGKVATPTGLEPATSALTGRRANQLRYGATPVFRPRPDSRL